MRYAIISDIHSNLEALSRFISFIPKLNIHKIICLGDIVGYNANPNECIQTISNLSSLEIIRGNHDRAVAFKDCYEFSRNASESVRWTIINIDKDNDYYLQNLAQGPMVIDNNFAICHGSALDEDKYLVSSYSTKPDFTWMKENYVGIMFFGHTHQQTAYICDEKNNIDELSEKEINIKENMFYIINPGSIGQPRDNDPRASFAIYDSSENIVNIIRFEYEYHLTQKKIIESGLPKFLAERLQIGR